MSFKTLLCLFGGRRDDLGTLEMAFALARRHGAALRILHLAPPPAMYAAVADYGAAALAAGMALDLMDEATVGRGRVTERKAPGSAVRSVSVVTVRASRRYGTLSPLRYPGGKAALAGLFGDLIEAIGIRRCTYVEPYAGGAGAGVALLREGLVDREACLKILDAPGPIKGNGWARLLQLADIEAWAASW